MITLRRKVVKLDIYFNMNTHEQNKKYFESEEFRIWLEMARNREFKKS